VDDPKDELAERRKAREETLEQYLCGECSFGLFHLCTDQGVYCANCGMESLNLRVIEQRTH
jgi:hypothetical protein